MQERRRREHAARAEALDDLLVEQRVRLAVRLDGRPGVEDLRGAEAVGDERAKTLEPVGDGSRGSADGHPETGCGEDGRDRVSPRHP